MIIFTIKDKIDGLCSALFFSFTQKIIPDKVYDSDIIQAELGAEIINIRTSKAESERVQKALNKYGGYEIMDKIYTCMLSCDSMAVSYAFKFAYATLEQRKDVLRNLTDKDVANFYYTLQTVWTEKHRILGFLRFKQTTKGVLYAEYSPDNDITEIIAPHFFKRLDGSPFLIHDLKRGKIAISDGKAILFDDTCLKASISLSDEEKELENLWKKYYNEIAIKQRKNLRYQTNNMPKRYRRYMSETYEDFT